MQTGVIPNISFLFIFSINLYLIQFNIISTFLILTFVWTQTIFKRLSKINKDKRYESV
jgi:hypothetical protein